MIKPRRLKSTRAWTCIIQILQKFELEPGLLKIKRTERVSNWIINIIIATGTGSPATTFKFLDLSLLIVLCSKRKITSVAAVIYRVLDQRRLFGHPQEKLGSTKYIASQIRQNVHWTASFCGLICIVPRTLWNLIHVS